MNAAHQHTNESVTLKVQSRTSDKAKHLRKQNLVPLVLYGKKIKNQSLVVDRKTVTATLKDHGTTTLIDLVIAEQLPVKVLIREPQYHPLTHELLHADLYQVDLSQKITASVPIVFTGISAAVEDLGGTLIETKDSVEVECLPQDLPHELNADISQLKTFEEVLHVRDLIVSDRVEILDEPEEVLASVAEPRSEEELAALDEAVEEDVEKVEVVEGKEEESAEADGEQREGSGKTGPIDQKQSSESSK